MEDHPSQLTNLLLFFSCAGVLFSLPAIWASLYRGNRILRITVFFAPLVLLFPTGAYELILLLLAQSIIAVVGTSIGLFYMNNKQLTKSNADVESEHGRKLDIRFKIADLFLLTTFVAGVIAISTTSAQDPHLYGWLISLILGFLTGIIILLSTYLKLGYKAKINKRKASGKSTFLYKNGLLVLLAIVAIPAIVGCIAGWNGMHEIWAIVGGVSFGFSFLFAILWLWHLSQWQPFSTDKSTHTRALKLTGRIGLVAAIIIALIPTTMLYWELARPLPPIHSDLPQNNSYPELLRIGRAIEEIGLPSEGFDPPSAFSAFVLKANPLLDEAREYLNRECYVVLDTAPRKIFEMPNAPFGGEPVVPLQRLARALDIEADAAAKKGNTDEAINTSLDCLQLSRQAQRFGLLSNHWASVYIEQIGRTRLRKLFGNLNREQIRKIIRKLKVIDESRDPIRNIVEREVLWESHVYGWKYRSIQYFFEDFQFYEDILIDREQQRDAELRLLMTELAIRAYRLQHTALASSLDNLVPDYLPDVPRDPYAKGKKLLIYRLTDDGHLLYSVGPNGRDDGGVKVSWSRFRDGEGDMFFDTRDIVDSPNGQPAAADEGIKERETTDD